MANEFIYPTEKELLRIKTAEVTRDNFYEFMDSIKDYWSAYGSWEHRGNFYRLATGGWSENENIISALESNSMFWICFWVLSKVGGLYIFGYHNADLDKYDEEEELIKELL